MKKNRAKCSPHGWTVDTLETFLSSQDAALSHQLLAFEDRNKERFISAERTVQTALLSSEKAIIKAESATEHRFDAVNEFRAQLSMQEKDLLGRPEYLADHRSLLDRIEKAEKTLTELVTRNAVSKATPIMIVLVVGSILNVLMFCGLFIGLFLHIRGS